MSKIFPSRLPSDLGENLWMFREEWESFALRVLKQKAIHCAPRFILVYDLETTKEFEPKFHGFLRYDIDQNGIVVYTDWFQVVLKKTSDTMHMKIENG